MTTLIPTASKVIFLQLTFDLVNAPSVYKLGLYTNDVIFDNNLLITDLIEPLGDYMRRDLSPWVLTKITETPAVATDQINCYITGWTGSIFGYFITVVIDGNEELLLVQDLPAPFVLSGPTDSIGIIPKIDVNDTF